MSKLPSEYQFLDLSDYGRPFGKAIAKQLQHSRFHAVHVTFLFVFTAVVSLGFLWQGYPIVVRPRVAARVEVEIAADHNHEKAERTSSTNALPFS